MKSLEIQKTNLNQQCYMKPQEIAWEYVLRDLNMAKSIDSIFQCWRPFGYFWLLYRLCSTILEECPLHNMAAWIHHLLTKVQQMKLMRSSFRCCAWLEKEWHWVSVAPCLGLTCAGWCQRSFHASQAQSSSCIMWMESWRCMKTWETKGLMEKLQCCPALTYQLMCIQHGVLSTSSQIVKESLR